MPQRAFHLGNQCTLKGKPKTQRCTLPAHWLTTHGVIVGATGSGKSALATIFAEEALRSQIPVLMIDVKGDLPNLGLMFPTFSPQAIAPWLSRAPGDTRAVEELAVVHASERRAALEAWGIDEPELARIATSFDLRVITPGSTAGEPLNLLSALARPSADVHTNPEAARASISAAVSLLMRLVGQDPDPGKSRYHALLSVLIEQRLRAGQSADLGTLLQDVLEPPMETVGSLPIDSFVSPKQRAELAASLNTLLASPTLASWLTGSALDIAEWLRPPSERGPNAKTPAVIVSVAHLDDDDRALVLGILLEELLTWVRGLPGSQELRALVIFDEVYGFLPPHPHRPPTKQPLMLLLKQARAFGVGVLLATQNPMDLDYRALSNAGLWCVGRLQTDADRERVIEGLSEAAGTGPLSAAALAQLTKQLADRWFVMRNTRDKEGTLLLQPRWAASFLRGPMTPREISTLREAHQAK